MGPDKVEKSALINYNAPRARGIHSKLHSILLVLYKRNARGPSPYDPHSPTQVVQAPRLERPAEAYFSTNED